MHRLKSILQKIILADFKTTEKKFLDQGIAKEEAKEYLDAFKKLRDKNRIQDTTEKDIDSWGKKSFEEFKSFVDKLSKEKSKTEIKKLKKMKGAELIAENEDWYVYHITTQEASMLYGSGTKWCITEPDRDGFHWKREASKKNIYFLISKKLENDNNFYKIAVTIDSNGRKIYWDALNDNSRSIPSELNIPKIEFEKLDLNSMSEEAQLEAVKQNGSAIEFIKNPSEELQLEAVKQNGSAIEFIKNPSEELQLIAVKQRGFAMEYIKKPSEEVQLESVKQNGYAIQFIKNPSEQVQLKAVKQRGRAIEYIKNPSEQVQLEAVKEDGFALEFIKNPSEQVQLEAVKIDKYAIQYIDNPSEKVQLEAVTHDSRAILVIKNPTDKVKEYVKNNATSSLTQVLAKVIVLSDFKTTKKKFIDQGIEEDQIDTYFEDFKFLKDHDKIRSIEDKNIDNWGKKPWEEFVEFVDELKKEKSKSEEIREMKREGAELVAEDDNWRVYKITTYEASRTYGSGKWCITRDEKWWKKYTRRSQFYFMLSKTRPETDSWHKIALQLNKNGKKTYWDNEDTSHKKLPSDLHMVKYKELFEDTGEELSAVEQIIEDINAFAEDEYDYLTDPDQNDSANYVYEQELEFNDVDDDLKERLEILEKLAGNLGKDYESVVKDCCYVEFEDNYYRNNNELTRMRMGGNERELPDELKEEYEALTEEEQNEVKRGVDSHFDGQYVSIGSDEDSFVLILDEEKVEDAIKELSENLKVHKHLNTPKADLLALKGKNVSTRKLALEKTENQNTIEKAYLDNEKSIRELAASKIKNPKMLEDIAKNSKEDPKVRVAAINNENYMDEAYLKNIVETYKSESDDEADDMSDWSLYTTAFDKIKDIKWLGKYVMQPGVNGSKRDDFIEMLAKKRKGRKLAPNYVAYLKQLASLMLKENQSYGLKNIVKEMPDTEQTFFKKVASLPSDRNYHDPSDPRIIAITKIKDDDKFLKNLIAKLTKPANHHGSNNAIDTAFEGIHDQAYLTKCLFDEKFKDHDASIAKNITDEKVLVKWLTMTNGINLDSVIDRINSEKAKISVITSPKIWDWKKAKLIEKCSTQTLKKCLKIMQEYMKKNKKDTEIPDTIEMVKKQLPESIPF